MTGNTTLNWNGSTILITGGSGSLGSFLVDYLLEHRRPKQIRILSNDPAEQSALRRRLEDDRVAFYIADIREPGSLADALSGVDLLVHAAALKDVSACEARPFDASEINIAGSQNVARACIEADVKSALLISTDKAVNPTTVYGATKLCAERVFVAANFDRDHYRATHLSVVRFGNLAGTKGSAIPVLLAQRRKGTLRLTDPKMTRFWISLELASAFIVQCLESMEGGEVFVPRTQSVRLTDLADTIAPDGDVAWVGARPGEKIHEVLLAAQESTHALDLGSFYVIQPHNPAWTCANWKKGRPLPSGFSFRSDLNDRWVAAEQIQAVVSTVR
ncbi:MAG: polysaccharide biosynthesis protein [Nitrospirae bacterium]|nr:polysaccharide biosynthesis protein [Nitrospirota bacterium]